MVITGKLQAACGLSTIRASNVFVGATGGGNKGELLESAGFQVGRNPKTRVAASPRRMPGIVRTGCEASNSVSRLDRKTSDRVWTDIEMCLLPLEIVLRLGSNYHR